MTRVLGQLTISTIRMSRQTFLFVAISFLFHLVEVTRCWFVPMYSNEKRISELNIAGSHDSMSYTTDIGAARCQDWDLRTQLDNGIRFIDIRFRHFRNGLFLHHGPVFLNKNFGDVLNTVGDYLRANPTEFVLMSINKEHTEEQNNGESFAAIVKRKLQSHGNQWWRGGEHNPTVGAIRGKFVVIQRFGGEQLGIPWNSLNDVPESAKADAISNQINYALAANKQTIFVNFISLSNAENAAVQIFAKGNPKQYASRLNPHTHMLLEKFGDVKHKRVGIIVMDFAVNDIIQMLNDGVSGGTRGTGDLPESVRPNPAQGDMIRVRS